MRVFILVFYLIYIDFKRNYVFSFRPIRSSLKFKNSIFSLFSNSLDKYEKEFEKYRGTPELVDLLENLVLKEPGLEVDINLYRQLYPFPLDDFQEQGLTALIQGNNVIVSTPTGSGKTLVGELAIYFALMMGLRIAYTTPLKALSNQKFNDFKAKYGGDRVGLLTGDISINRGAPITIMTTEVFRNIIYGNDAEDQLAGLFAVVFDEFHYMNDPDRGTVWEESVISCPKHVRILALSATMGNVADIQGWINSIHGPTQLIVSDHRPVPLRYLFAMKFGLMSLFRDPNAGPGGAKGVVKGKGGILDPSCAINPSILKLEESAVKNSQLRATRSGRPLKSVKVNPQNLIPKYSDLANDLSKANLLPAIVFIFSRVGCEQAAQMVLQSKNHLLLPEESSYISHAITNFARNNPEIPISRNMVLMLKAGVAVHHAGLIPVWKSFIEDLFNGNKIKILFATETLAAGVNMPARTTVISTVTKRINSEIVKLKTSQLLQMAGRAGRRGKDVEGTVVILRNRFEDVKIGHKILTSAIDGIKSHFKTSYSLTVNLLETKSLDECRALIERGFGAYLLQQKKSLQKIKSETSDIDLFRSVLQKYSLKGSREYLKILRRLEKEKKNEEFLIQNLKDTDSELVNAIADYMPIGIGMQLYNGESGFFLGDVKWGNNNRNSGYGILTKEENLYIVLKEHIKAFSETDSAIQSKYAQDLLELVGLASSWDEILIDTKRPLLKGVFPIGTIQDIVSQNDKLASAIEQVRVAKPFPRPQIPGSIIRQQGLVKELEQELSESPISQAGEGRLVLDALKYVANLKDPLGFVASPNLLPSSSNTSDVYAWRMFQSVVNLLQKFEALNDTVATDLGQMVGSLSADNELWLAMVLQHKEISKLKPFEFAAVISALVIDGYKASNAMFKYKASENVQLIYDELDILAWELKSAQMAASIDFPVQLTREVGGLVESWANGVSWRDICKDTSLDQGDLCRLLRRTVEICKQIPLAYGIPPVIAQLAVEASSKMDRFPVSDDQDTTQYPSSGVGFGETGEDKSLIELDESSIANISDITDISDINTQFEDLSDDLLDFIDEKTNEGLNLDELYKILNEEDSEINAND